MCLAVPGQVLELSSEHGLRTARVDFGGVRKRVCVETVPDAGPGDWILVHAGFALQILDEAAAQDSRPRAGGSSTPSSPCSASRITPATRGSSRPRWSRSRRPWGGEVPADDVPASAGPVIRVAPLVRDLVVRLSDGAPAAELARRFHVGLAERLAAATSGASRASGLRRVVVTGGCLQNRPLRDELRTRLAARGLEVCVSRRLPPNDGGLAVGQEVVAAAGGA
jgi:hydrogenase assembly chaperone HypC/HupF